VLKIQREVSATMPDRYRTTSKTLSRAKQLRRNMTEAEKKLWYRIRLGQLDGHQFRKQVPVDPYILDFACLRKRLALEVDGSQHAEISKAEEARNRFLRGEGYTVVRYWNSEVMRNIDGVLLDLLAKLNGLPDRF
jgi:very-short-patch-repair endonuclease